MLDRDTLLSLYKTLILPILDYGDFVYHGISQQDSDTLQKLQNTACRAILRADMYSSIAGMHEELNVNMLYQRRCQHIVAQMFKFAHSLGPKSCQNLVVYMCDKHHVKTRAADNLLLYIPQTRLKVTDNDFAVLGPRLWNQLPENIRAIDTLNDFKREIKNIVFD